MTHEKLGRVLKSAIDPVVEYTDHLAGNDQGRLVRPARRGGLRKRRILYHGRAVDAFGRVQGGDTVYEPDGININAGCGSTHLEQLKERVRKAALIWASRSMATRTAALIVDETGELDGDRIMAVCAAHMKKGKASCAVGRLSPPCCLTWVCTPMLKKRHADRMLQCGKFRYVLEMMLNKGIYPWRRAVRPCYLLEYASTGEMGADRAAVHVHSEKQRQKCSEIAAEVVPWPQVMINVKGAE